MQGYFAIQQAWYLGRRARYEEAKQAIAKFNALDAGVIGSKSLGKTAEAYVAVASGAVEAAEVADLARRVARRHGTVRWRRVSELLIAYSKSGTEFGATITAIAQASPWNVTFVADLISRRLDEFDNEVLKAVETAAHLHPGRWRFVLRGQSLRRAWAKV